MSSGFRFTNANDAFDFPMASLPRRQGDGESTLGEHTCTTPVTRPMPEKTRTTKAIGGGGGAETPVKKNMKPLASLPWRGRRAEEPAQEILLPSQHSPTTNLRPPPLPSLSPRELISCKGNVLWLYDHEISELLGEWVITTELQCGQHRKERREREWGKATFLPVSGP